MKLTCVQCGEELLDYKIPILIDELESGLWTMSVCVNPQCPNFGLIQIGMEKCQKYLKRKKHK